MKKMKNNKILNDSIINDTQVQLNLESAVVKDLIDGLTYEEIGTKYNVNMRFIEAAVTSLIGVNVSSLGKVRKITSLEPKDFAEEKTTVWSFKSRGSWATHNGDYRGNWSPYIPRNVILKYSKPGDKVLDCFCGAGTTAVESKLLGRRCIAIDINDVAIVLAKKNLDFDLQHDLFSKLHADFKDKKIYTPELFTGDARSLPFIKNESIDLICTHPPYANIINYTKNKVGDLSFCTIEQFLEQMSQVARENFRVLKSKRICAILIGDTRKQKHVIPMAFRFLQVYLDAGFKLKELIIKRQHNCKTTGFWYDSSIKNNFLLLAHEYLLIFEKPEVAALPLLNESSPAYKSQFKRTKKQSEISEFALESTTVWLFPENEFEKRIDSNVFQRYSSNNSYAIINCSHDEHNTTPRSEIKIASHHELIFIKASIPGQEYEQLDIKYFLTELKNIIDSVLSRPNKHRYIAIQTNDITLNGFTEPVAKNLIDRLSLNEKLWLKEIIILIKENGKSAGIPDDHHLQKVHQYILVYEVISNPAPKII